MLWIAALRSDCDSTQDNTSVTTTWFIPDGEAVTFSMTALCLIKDCPSVFRNWEFQRERTRRHCLLCPAPHKCLILPSPLLCAELQLRGDVPCMEWFQWNGKENKKSSQREKKKKLLGSWTGIVCVERKERRRNWKETQKGMQTKIQHAVCGGIYGTQLGNKEAKTVNFGFV